MDHFLSLKVARLLIMVDFIFHDISLYKFLAIFETILNFELNFLCLFWYFLFVVLLSIEVDAFSEKVGML